MRRAGLWGRVAALVVVVCLVAPFLPVEPARAQLQRLSTPICAQVAARIACYDAVGTPRSLSPADEIALDFDISPDGEWLAYRATPADPNGGESAIVRMISVFGGDAVEIDRDAPPPATLDAEKRTLAWSPDGFALAYVTASGLRAAFPDLGGGPRFSEVTDRRYADLRFSPDASALAAQTDDGSWIVFRIAQQLTFNARLERLREVNVTAEVAWQDTTTLIVAPASGGLYRLNAVDPTALYAALPAAGLFTQLIRLPDGTLRAFSLEIGRGYGKAVEIAADGTVTPLGEASLDARLRWTRGGRAMLYLTSGTPIVVNPATGGEDTLPIRGASRVVWTPSRTESVPTLQLDADLFFLAPDPIGAKQVWRLVRNGQSPIFPLTQSALGISAFSISPDKAKLAVAEGQTLRVLPLTAVGIATPTPTVRPLFGTPTPVPVGPVATLRRDDAPHLSWSPDSTQLAYADVDGVFVVASDGLSAARLIAAHPSGQRYESPAFSPDGGALLVEVLNVPAGTRAYAVLPLRDGVAIPTLPPLKANGIDSLQWSVPNNNRVGLLAVQAEVTTQLSFLSADGATTSAQPIAQFAQPVSGVTFVRNLTPPPLYLFSLVGWRTGPQLVQYFSLVPNSAATQYSLQALGAPFLLPGSFQISPTGRFAVSVRRNDDPERSHLLIILDLQNLRTISIADAVNVSAVVWVF